MGKLNRFHIESRFVKTRTCLCGYRLASPCFKFQMNHTYVLQDISKTNSEANLWVGHTLETDFIEPISASVAMFPQYSASNLKSVTLTVSEIFDNYFVTNFWVGHRAKTGVVNFLFAWLCFCIILICILTQGHLFFLKYL